MKNKRSYLLLLIIVLLLSFGSLVFARDNQLPEASFEFYVYDEVGIIDEELEDYIININKEMYSKTGAQVVVATVDDNRNMDVKLLATKIYRDWGIGSKEKNNGVLMLISIVGEDSREIWLETGYGLEGALPDSIQKRIVDDNILPHFRDGDYRSGILDGFNQLISKISEEYGVILGGGIEALEVEEEKMPRIFVIMYILVALFFIDFFVFDGKIAIALSIILSGNNRRPPRGGGGFGGYRGSSGSFGRTSSSGRSSSRGSSGGGGRSGGGGAGGTW